MSKSFFLNRKDRVLELFGLIWIIDGLLQFQPKLLSKQFISNVLNPLFVNGNSIIVSLYHSLTKVFLLSPIFFGILIGLIQISLGIFIITKKFRIKALYFSIGWSLFIWIFGQDLGGLFNHQFSFFMSSLGPAFFYFSLSLYFLLLSKKRDLAAFMTIVISWISFWLSGLLSSILNPNIFKSMLIMPVESKPPIFLRNINLKLFNFTYSHIDLIVVLVIIISIYSLFFYFLPKNLSKYLNIIWVLLLLYVLFYVQSLGQFYSGLMTDVGYVPLILLIGYTVWSSSVYVNLLIERIEKKIF